MRTRAKNFLSGIIEGFYGPPWSAAEREELLRSMAAEGLNTYVYAPKDDLKQRAMWRKPYGSREAAELKNLVRTCDHRGIRFFYALSPGLDICYSSRADGLALRRKLGQLGRLGCRNFCLLFDDIPGEMRAEDRSRHGTLASAQGAVANSLFEWSRTEGIAEIFIVCPTAYCGRMARAGVGGENYLREFGAALHPGIDIFWTGSEIISKEITVQELRTMEAVLRRKPVIWDNLHANDYDGRRFFAGPYAGRGEGLRGVTRGILSNPNTEFRLNFSAVRTLGRYCRGRGRWNARREFEQVVEEWAPRFRTVHGEANPKMLKLFLECFYLPYEHGAGASKLLCEVKEVLSATTPAGHPAFQSVLRQLQQLREFCGSLAESEDRALFYALSRRAWELREELDLLEKFLRFKAEESNKERPFHSDFHLPRTFRGGIAAELQQLLRQSPDGSFTAMGGKIHE